jgi:hypothetical protein
MEEAKKVEAETPPIPNLASLELSSDVADEKAAAQAQPKAIAVVESKLSSLYYNFLLGFI